MQPCQDDTDVPLVPSPWRRELFNCTKTLLHQDLEKADSQSISGSWAHVPMICEIAVLTERTGKYIYIYMCVCVETLICLFIALLLSSLWISPFILFFFCFSILSIPLSNGRVETGDHFILPSRVSLWDLSPTKPIVPATNSGCNGLTYIYGLVVS